MHPILDDPWYTCPDVRTGRVQVNDGQWVDVEQLERVRQARLLRTIQTVETR